MINLFLLLGFLMPSLLFRAAVDTRMADAAFATQVPPPPPTPTQVIEPQTIPMELLASRPVVRVKINEKGPFAFLVVPDAAATVIDRRLADELGLRGQGASGQSSVSVMINIAVGTNELHNVLATVDDVSRLVPGLGPAAGPVGLLNASLWPKSLVTIDYRRWRVDILPGTLADPNGQDVFDLKGGSDTGVILDVAGQKIPCRVDPLFSGGLALSNKYQSLVPLSGRSGASGSTSAAQTQNADFDAQLTADARVGTFLFPKPLIKFEASEQSCRIGARLLIGFAVTYDVANFRIRIAH